MIHSHRKENPTICGAEEVFKVPGSGDTPWHTVNRAGTRSGPEVQRHINLMSASQHRNSHRDIIELKLTGLQGFGISAEWQPLMSFSLILLDMNVVAADLQRDVNHTTELLF